VDPFVDAGEVEKVVVLALKIHQLLSIVVLSAAY